MDEQQDTTVATYPSKRTALDAVRVLKRSGFSMSRVSFVCGARDVSTRTLARVRVGNGTWTGLFALPGLGPTLISGQLAENFAGPLAGLLARSTSTGSGEVVFTRGLARLGVPRRDASALSAHIRQGDVVVIVSGGRREIRTAASLLVGKSVPSEIRTPAYPPHF